MLPKPLMVFSIGRVTITSTVLNLLVRPTLALRYGRFDRQATEAE